MRRVSGERRPILSRDRLKYLGAIAAGSLVMSGVTHYLAWGEERQATSAVATAQVSPNPYATPEAQADSALSHDYDNMSEALIISGVALSVVCAVGAAGVALASRRNKQEEQLAEIVPIQQPNVTESDFDEITTYLSDQ